jgi:hypothetical protein
MTCITRSRLPLSAACGAEAGGSTWGAVHDMPRF